MNAFAEDFLSFCLNLKNFRFQEKKCFCDAKDFLKFCLNLFKNFRFQAKKTFAMSCAKDFLNAAGEFRIHTGNVISWKELKQKNFGNPSDELIECLRLQISQWKPEPNSLQPGQGICLCNNKQYCWPSEDSGYNREELKITLKV